MSILPFKYCKGCEKWKLKSEFYKRHGKPNPTCKKCEIAKARQWQANNKEQHLANKRRYRENHKETEDARAAKWRQEHPEGAKKIATKWRENNRELAQERTKVWGEKNRDKRNGYSKKYRKANPVKRLLWQSNRRARIIGNGGEITEREWEDLKAFYNYTCLCCKRQEPEIELTLDHVKSIADGGKNVIENAQPLCGPCNSRKGKREIDYR